MTRFGLRRPGSRADEGRTVGGFFDQAITTPSPADIRCHQNSDDGIPCGLRKSVPVLDNGG